ncbi:hypothetical protein [Acinetobacter sp. YH12124]|uniref:hypothetical protein n=1 Tax=Acinetobacter sp. YH12124 TaxID=2601109 RepID=UPI0015D2A738|nr:hypothetical protein [Acinetobacter sp. YH12124]
MAVSEQTPYIEYVANGTTTSFALEFDCENRDHLIVLVDDIEPVVGTWSLSSGAVVFNTAPENGKKITIQRNTPFSRTTDYQSYNNSFRPQSVNGDFDRVWLKLQELGVTDWLLRLYIDRLHGEQKTYIDNLKTYVDDKDNELRAYLMDEIRKQGVALDQLDDYYNYLMQRLAQIAIDKEWMAEFVIDASGKSQQEINDSVFRVNAKLLGIVPFLDVTSQLEHYLNDDVTHEIFLPKGEYVLSRKITVNSIHPKKIVLEHGAYFKTDTAAGVVLFDIYSHLEFENLSFDFDGKGCFIAVRYNPNCGIVRLKNTTFKNLKDIDSTRGSTILSVSAVGNFLDIDGVHFSDCLKRGNGSITDSAGSLNGLYVYGSSNLLGGKIDNVSVENFHNIDSLENIIYEDTTGIYVATGGLPIPLHIGTVKGNEFGKRLVKLQCSSAKLDYAEGISETGDSLSVVGILREVGFFSSNNNIIGTVIAKGNMDAAVADMGVNNSFDRVEIDVYGSNSLNNGATHAGLYLGTGVQGSKIKYLKSRAKRPIMFNLELSDIDVLDIVIDHAELETKDQGGQFLNIAGNSTTSVGSLKNLTIKHLMLKNDPTASIGSGIITTHNVDRGIKNLKINSLEIFDYLSNTSPISLGSYNFVDGLEINNVIYHPMNGESANTGDVLTFANSKGLKIDKFDLIRNSNRGIYINNSYDIEIGQNVKLGKSQIANVVVAGSSSNITVHNKDLSITDASNLREIMRPSGTTTQRPKRAKIGFNYFDTTINQLLVCTTSAVIAADGSVTADAIFSVLPKLVQVQETYVRPILEPDGVADVFVNFAGVKVGDAVVAAYTIYHGNIEVSAVVSAADMVRVKFKNIGTESVPSSSGILNVKLI